MVLDAENFGQQSGAQEMIASNDAPRRRDDEGLRPPFGHYDVIDEITSCVTGRLSQTILPHGSQRLQSRSARRQRAASHVEQTRSFSSTATAPERTGRPAVVRALLCAVHILPRAR